MGEGGQCRGAFAAASSILTGALLLIHQRREKERGREDKMGERKQRHFSAVYLESQYYIDCGREGSEGGRRAIDQLNFLPLLSVMPSTEQTLPESRSDPSPPSASLLSVCQL